MSARLCVVGRHFIVLWNEPHVILRYFLMCHMHGGCFEFFIAFRHLGCIFCLFIDGEAVHGALRGIFGIGLCRLGFGCSGESFRHYSP